jgi:hypothetical protein
VCAREKKLFDDENTLRHPTHTQRKRGREKEKEIIIIINDRAKKEEEEEEEKTRKKRIEGDAQGKEEELVC